MIVGTMTLAHQGARATAISMAFRQGCGADRAESLAISQD